MDDQRRTEAERLRSLPPSLRPWPMAWDTRWQMACWIHQRPGASLAALIIPAALMGAFMGWAFMVSLDGGAHAVDWLLVVLPTLLFMLTGFANWAIGASCARRARRRMDPG